VLVQPEMERGRSPLVSIPPFRSCQMALPLRPRARPCSISSRYSLQILADGGEGSLGASRFCEKGLIESGVTMAGFGPESGVTCMAGFAGARRPHPGRHTTTPAVFR
jgi:hypothetical protein